jgi:hypothetical protein
LRSAGSPRAWRTATAASVTARAASVGENLPSIASGAPNTPRAGIDAGSPAPPDAGASARFARVRGPVPSESRLGHAPARGCGRERGPRQAGRTIGLQQDDGPPIAGERRGHGLQPGAQEGDPGGRPRVGVEQRVEGQEARRLAAEAPARERVRLGQAGRGPLHGHLPDHQPDAGALGRLQGGALGGEPFERLGRRDTERDHRGTLDEPVEAIDETRLDGRQRAVVEGLHEPAHERIALLEGEPRVALAPARRAGRTEVPARDPDGTRPPRVGVEARRREDRMEQGQPQRRGDLGRAQIAVDPGEDRVEAPELSLRVQVQDRVRQGFRRGTPDGEAPPELVAHGRIHPERAGELDVGRLGRRVAQLVAPAAAIQAGGAAEGAPDGDRARAGDGRLPHQLLGGERAATGRAGRREALADPAAQAGGPERRRAHALERGVEVAQVRRPNDDVREEPGQG